MHRHKQQMEKIWFKIINLSTYLNKNRLINNAVNQKLMQKKIKIISQWLFQWLQMMIEQEKEKYKSSISMMRKIIS